MSNYLRIKIALATAGILLLLWGLRIDDERVRWFAMGLLAVSVLMRLIPKRFRGDASTTDAS